MNVFLLEDDAKVAGFLQQGLAEEGWSVIHVSNGLQALDVLNQTAFDVLILDIMVPQLDGLSLLKKIRSSGLYTPALLLTARDAVEDRVLGLNSGADDYLIKPFSFDELVARLNALVRRKNTFAGDPLVCGDLKLDPTKHTVYRSHKKIDLTQREFRLLELLLRNQGHVLSRVDIEESIWGLNEEPESNVVDVFINHLRSKIDKPFSYRLIHTVRGFGYKIEAPHEF